MNFRRNNKNPELWQEYYKSIAQNRLLSWKIVKTLEKSFKELVESFEEEFECVVNDIYSNLSFSHKQETESQPSWSLRSKLLS